MEQNTKSDLDLVVICMVFFNWLKSFFAGVASFFATLLRLAWKKKIVMIISLVVGAALGYAFVEYEDYDYKIEGESQLRINTSDAVTVNEVVKSLDFQCKNKRYEQLAKQLNVSKEVASKIKRIESFYWIDGRHDGNATGVDKTESYLKDTSIARMDDRLQIKVSISDIDLLPQMDDMLAYSICNNERIKYRHQLRLETDAKFASQFLHEANTLDSLRLIEYFGSISNQNKVQIDGPMIVSNKDKQLYHDQIMQLLIKSREYEDNLLRNQMSVQFITEFVLTKVSPRWLKVPLLGAIAFSVLTLLCLYVISRKKKIKAFLEAE